MRPYLCQLYEGKMTARSDHRSRIRRAGTTVDIEFFPRRAFEEHSDPSLKPNRFTGWIRLAVENGLSVEPVAIGCLGWKDITTATNERTVISAVIPRVAVGHYNVFDVFGH